MNLTIKSAKVQLNGNLLTGDTYEAKGYIKAYLGGKWDSNSKGWRVDVSKVEKILSTTGGMIKVDNSAPQTKSHNHNSICPRCHTYCYGDCQA